MRINVFLKVLLGIVVLGWISLMVHQSALSRSTLFFVTVPHWKNQYYITTKGVVEEHLDEWTYQLKEHAQRWDKVAKVIECIGACFSKELTGTEIKAKIVFEDGFVAVFKPEWRGFPARRGTDVRSWSHGPLNEVVAQEVSSLLDLSHVRLAPVLFVQPPASLFSNSWLKAVRVGPVLRHEDVLPGVLIAWLNGTRGYDLGQYVRLGASSFPRKPPPLELPLAMDSTAMETLLQIAAFDFIISHRDGKRLESPPEHTLVVSGTNQPAILVDHTSTFSFDTENDVRIAGIRYLRRNPCQLGWEARKQLLRWMNSSLSSAVVERITCPLPHVADIHGLDAMQTQKGGGILTDDQLLHMDARIKLVGEWLNVTCDE